MQHLSKHFADRVTESFKRESLTAGRFSTDYSFKGAKTIEVFTPKTVPMSNYTRSGSGRYGTVTEMEDVVQELTLSRDRGFAFTVDKVMGLDLGADDYLAKPFGMMEMVSRIRAVLRRSSSGTNASALGMGGLAMDVASHTVTAEGIRIALTLKEFELLRLFLSSPGRVFSREQLLEQVWGTDYVGESRTVDVHIATLRTKLGASGDYIRTVRGVGYRMEETA